MRSILCALALSLASTPALSAESIVNCADFKRGWTLALARLDLSRTAPTYGAASGADAPERIGGVAGVDGLVTCRDGSLGRLELRGAGDPVRFEKVVASALMGLDQELAPSDAGTMAAALKAEMRSDKTTATTSWGPYEITWTRREERKTDELIVDMAEN